MNTAMNTKLAGSLLIKADFNAALKHHISLCSVFHLLDLKYNLSVGSHDRLLSEATLATAQGSYDRV